MKRKKNRILELHRYEVLSIFQPKMINYSDIYPLSKMIRINFHNCHVTNCTVDGFILWQKKNRARFFYIQNVENFFRLFEQRFVCILGKTNEFFHFPSSLEHFTKELALLSTLDNNDSQVCIEVFEIKKTKTFFFDFCKKTIRWTEKMQ